MEGAAHGPPCVAAALLVCNNAPTVRVSVEFTIGEGNARKFGDAELAGDTLGGGGEALRNRIGSRPGWTRYFDAVAEQWLARTLLRPKRHQPLHSKVSPTWRLRALEVWVDRHAHSSRRAVVTEVWPACRAVGQEARNSGMEGVVGIVLAMTWGERLHTTGNCSGHRFKILKFFSSLQSRVRSTVHKWLPASPHLTWTHIYWVCTVPVCARVLILLSRRFFQQCCLCEIKVILVYQQPAPCFSGSYLDT